MSTAATVEALERETRDELTRRILPWWSEHAVDREGGGFFGCIGPDGRPDAAAPRGGILNARILWAFSAAYRALGDEPLRALADRAAGVIRERFLDPEHGGLHWSVDARGTPVDDRKHIYAQAFGVYALAEHHRATGSEKSLGAAIDLFRLIEEHGHDATHGGYLEAFDRRWRPLADRRLGATDLNAPKSENTHLHLLEACTTLLRAWRDPLLETRLRELVGLFTDRIVDRGSGHVLLFFDRDWTPLSRTVSFGHDIETSWLLEDAADAMGDAAVEVGARPVSLLLADTVLREGLDPDGGVFYEVAPDGTVDEAKEWWTQAESVVGFLAAYQATDRPELLAAAASTWEFIERRVLDHRNGEWYRRVDRDGSPQPQHEKAGPWKGPYHNSRMCLQVMERAEALRAGGRT